MRLSWAEHNVEVEVQEWEQEVLRPVLGCKVETGVKVELASPATQQRLPGASALTPTRVLSGLVQQHTS